MLGSSVIHVAIKNFRGHGVDTDIRRGVGTLWVRSTYCCSREKIQLMNGRLIVALILNTSTD